MKYKLFTPSNIDELDTKSLRIKKPYSLYKKQIFEIYYGEQNNILLIQTPECILKGYQIFQDTGQITFDTSFNNNIFIDALSKVITRIQERLSKRLSNTKFINPLQNQLLRLKSKNTTDIKFFDSNNNIIDITKLKRDDKLHTIFHIRDIIVYESICTLNFILHQVKKIEIVTPCLFNVPPPEARADTSGLPPGTDEKYKKMLAMGIPLQAVLHKMKMEKAIPASKALKLPAFLNDIAKGPLTLKSKPLQPNIKLPPTITTNQKVPTLSEILSAKDRLKSTNKTNISN